VFSRMFDWLVSGNMSSSSKQKSDNKKDTLNSTKKEPQQ